MRTKRQRSSARRRGLVAGPPLRLNAQSAQIIGMAAHELATRGFLLLNPATFRPATHADPVILALSSSRSKLLALPAETPSF